jgi:hypothetical protein
VALNEFFWTTALEPVSAGAATGRWVFPGDWTLPCCCLHLLKQLQPLNTAVSWLAVHVHHGSQPECRCVGGRMRKSRVCGVGRFRLCVAACCKWRHTASVEAAARTGAAARPWRRKLLQNGRRACYAGAPPAWIRLKRCYVPVDAWRSGVTGLAVLCRLTSVINKKCRIDASRPLWRPLLKRVAGPIWSAFAHVNMGLSWIEDESNTDTAFDAQFLCAMTFVPSLQTHWPSVAAGYAGGHGLCACRRPNQLLAGAGGGELATLVCG